jgi:alkylation response protein AidB-like acyl-CoA dehydrogenase
VIAVSALDVLPELLDAIGHEVATIEGTRTIPPGLLDDLREAGCLRLVVGAEHGGDALALPAALDVIEQLSRVHASVGWLIGQVALGHVVLGYLSADAREQIYADGPDVYVAGAAAPKGRAVRMPQGITVSGRWPLVSGSRHAEWLYLQCLLPDDDAVAQPAGAPPMCCVVLPSASARVLDTYRGIGLRGSASNDVLVKGVQCNLEFGCELSAAPCADWPIMRVPVATQAGLFAAAVMLGIASGAVEAVATLAAQKRPSFSSRRLADSALFQNALGEASVTVLAGDSLLRTEVRRADEAPASDAWLRSVGVKAAALATQTVESAYTLGGSSSVIDGSPLERRLRDVRSLTQHATLSRDNLARLGAELVQAA